LRLIRLRLLDHLVGAGEQRERECDARLPTAERVTARRAKRSEKLDPGQSASLDFPPRKGERRTGLGLIDLGLIDLGLIDLGLIDLGNDIRGGEGGSTI
jgi:hypothetical protein